ncbi:sulfite exporter TauE/SafE family protein [Alicyclobacillus fastidiosus]|uniref:Probable membrane transporter protein n=1 Tax=Alicyclobacillus fastidiosus TaxID=392011 RepID=A0ABV5AAK5_9BACL|nr:sulfite exporter TauE/SafE family protein [Alicyclobacillus fastidiosus]WEH11930.1 sulfite exporter TauE/SafE family protein [Alicyclobacillus fastidiosus]
MIVLTMLVVGLILGFVGAGGSGVIIALLTTVFGVSIHTALGTSLLAMVLTTISGAVSHFREGNVVTKTGAAIGGFGAIGAFAGSHIAHQISAHDLTWLTACMLFLSALLLWMRMFISKKRQSSQMDDQLVLSGSRFWLSAIGLGLVTGLLSGTFGIGSTPFIQIGLLLFFGMSIRQAAGTTMLVILPIALLGGIGYMSNGYLNVGLFFEVVIGTIVGTYIGAKFTKRLHPIVLKIAMVTVPTIGGLLLLM